MQPPPSIRALTWPARCCDPHPVRRPGAAPRWTHYARVDTVAILTRSGDRVQPWRSCRRSASVSGCCDPHPVRRPGAAPGSSRTRGRRGTRCDPHPVRRPGAAHQTVREAAKLGVVAILTRSGDRVQHRALMIAVVTELLVAILTRSGDRVQRSRRISSSSSARSLRSSPGPETGCSTSRSAAAWRRIPTRCDPHPVRRPGAAPSPGLQRYGDSGSCDPHPVRRPGAAAGLGVGQPTVELVAILTRSGDRVQRRARLHAAGQPRRLRSSPGPETGCSSKSGLKRRILATRVAILTRSGDRVQPGARGEVSQSIGRCDPHPVRRPGAANSDKDKAAVAKRCDPHPVRRPGAAGGGPARRPAAPPRCDPHPVRRPGAAVPVVGRQSLVRLVVASVAASTKRCDPHPVRRPGAAITGSSGRSHASMTLRSSPGASGQGMIRVGGHLSPGWRTAELRVDGHEDRWMTPDM